MAESDSKNRYPTGWRVLYRAAIFETNSRVLAKRLSDAEEAIVERMHELFRETGADAEGEREAMDDAMYSIRAWKIALDRKARAA